MRNEYDRVEQIINGLEEEFFEQNFLIETEMKCSKCNKLVIGPLFCECCKKLYCEGCINNKKCASCNNELSITIPKDLEDKLNKLKLKCKFYKDGCEDIIDYSEYIEHSKYCFYNIYKCKSCEFKSNINNMENHLKSCENTKYKCLICDQNILRRQLATHNNAECIEIIENLLKASNNLNNLGENFRLKQKIDELEKETKKLRSELKLEVEFREKFENIDEESKADIRFFYETEKNDVLDSKYYLISSDSR